MTHATALILHGIAQCDSCRAARTALRAAGYEVEWRDLRESVPVAAEIRRWREAVGDALLNTRSTTWRGLDAEARAGDPIELMAALPTLIKRPVIEDGANVRIGWSPATRAAFGL
ncbi:ArsC/Spx/MgsR family protein [uncultured Jannaschia sp.]|uniref:ArsC/Spx/MgsR family protein n=1 Tax=uncultured Jannaschia sp. TaxID=293347 RepID=UPI002622B526|nr:ArsC/Spx/MgsR family protein [uncultured Jannaschia sp.]